MPRERERERESFIRNNVHNGAVSGAGCTTVEFLSLEGSLVRGDVDPHGNGLGTCEANLNAATIRRVSAHRFRFFLSLSTRMRLTTSLQKLRFQDSEHAHWSAVSTVT